MSVLDLDKVDGIAINHENDALVLLLTDHLDWLNEYEHLVQLQGKINAYVTFIEDKQYKTIYPEKEFSGFCIRIHFLHTVSENCGKLVDVVKRRLAEQNIVLDINVTSS